MKIRFSRPLKTVSGRALVVEGPDGKAKTATLADVAAIALYDLAQPGMPGEERHRRGKLARRLMGAKELDLDAEDVALVKDAIGDYWKPDVVTPAWEMLEGRE